MIFLDRNGSFKGELDSFQTKLDQFNFENSALNVS